MELPGNIKKPSAKKLSTVKSFGSEFRKFLSDTQQDPPHLVEDHHKIEVVALSISIETTSANGSCHVRQEQSLSSFTRTEYLESSSVNASNNDSEVFKKIDIGPFSSRCNQAHHDANASRSHSTASLHVNCHTHKDRRTQEVAQNTSHEQEKSLANFTRTEYLDSSSVNASKDYSAVGNQLDARSYSHRCNRPGHNDSKNASTRSLCSVNLQVNCHRRGATHKDLFAQEVQLRRSNGTKTTDDPCKSKSKKSVSRSLHNDFLASASDATDQKTYSTSLNSTLGVKPLNHSHEKTLNSSGVLRRYDTSTSCHAFSSKRSSLKDISNMKISRASTFHQSTKKYKTNNSGGACDASIDQEFLNGVRVANESFNSSNDKSLPSSTQTALLNSKGVEVFMDYRQSFDYSSVNMMRAHSSTASGQHKVKMNDGSKHRKSPSFGREPSGTRTSFPVNRSNHQTVRDRIATKRYDKIGIPKNAPRTQNVTPIRPLNLNYVSNVHLMSANHSIPLLGESFTSPNISFNHIVTSTPKHCFPIDYSMMSSTQEEPLDLTLPSNTPRASPKAICLILPKVESKHENSNSPLDLRAVDSVATPEQTVHQLMLSHHLEANDPYNQDAVILSNVEPPYGFEKDNGLRHERSNEKIDAACETITSRTHSEDEDWSPDNDEEDSVDGDPTLLNDLTIYEYFQNYQTVISDDDSDDDCDASDNELAPRKRSAKNEHNDLLLPKRLLLTHDNPERYSTEQIEFNNISVQGVDNIEKEVVEIKISKQKLKRQNKRNKEKGLQYTRNDGTVVSARSIKSACSCRRYCGKKYPDMIRAQLLSNLLQLKMSGQNQFLANHISVINTARPKVCHPLSASYSCCCPNHPNPHLTVRCS